MALPDRPAWMHPLSGDPPTLDKAFAACIDVYRHHEVPTPLCRQCLSAEMENSIIKAARLVQEGQTPPAHDFGQIYFEHPDCVGGEDTIKLFTPHGLQTMLTGCPPMGFGNSYPEVLNSMLRAGFWFWPSALITPARALAARLFWDFFRDGHYAWPQKDTDDLLGPGDDIMSLCIACLIDPADLIAALVALDTPQSAEALCVAGHFTPEAPFYVSADTGRDTEHYKPVCDKIARALASREAQAVLHHVTPEWLQMAFWRFEGTYPDFATAISEYENYYDIHTIELRKSADRSEVLNWPALPVL